MNYISGVGSYPTNQNHLVSRAYSSLWSIACLDNYLCLNEGLSIPFKYKGLLVPQAVVLKKLREEVYNLLIGYLPCILGY